MWTRRDGFARLLDAIGAGTRGLPVVFPVHPRTAKTLRALADLPAEPASGRAAALSGIQLPGAHAKAVITDSGGITEETTVMGVPCLTLRDTTERPETVTIGTNELIGTNPAHLPPALARVMAGQWKTGAIPDRWDGQAAGRIVAALEKLLCG